MKVNKQGGERDRDAIRHALEMACGILTENDKRHLKDAKFFKMQQF